MNAAKEGYLSPEVIKEVVDEMKAKTGRISFDFLTEIYPLACQRALSRKGSNG